MASTAAASLIIHAPLLIATGAVFIAVDLCMVGLRIWARMLKRLPLGADDYTCMVSCLFVVGMAITVIVETSYKRFGYPAESSPDSNATNAEYPFYPAQILQIPALGLVKISFLLFYQRIFVKTASPRFHRVCWVFIALITAWTIAFTFAWIFPCGKNFDLFWHSVTVRAQRCVDVTALVDSLAVTDFVFDLIVIGMPLPMIWRLRLSLTRKIQLSGVFLLGAVTVAASCVRLAVFLETEAVLHGPGGDFEYLDTGAIYWALVEAGLAVIAACLPTLSWFFTDEGLNSAIQSARSALSLNSVFSNGSGRDRQNLPEGRQPQGDTTVDDAYNAMTRSNVGLTNATVESEASHELPEIPEATLQRVHGIVVGTKLTQSSEPADRVYQGDLP